jgi:hypothetical protein
MRAQAEEPELHETAASKTAKGKGIPPLPTIPPAYLSLTSPAGNVDRTVTGHVFADKNALPFEPERGDDPQSVVFSPTGRLVSS